MSLSLTSDICEIISKYFETPKYYLYEWITPTEKINETNIFKISVNEFLEGT